MGRHRGRVCVYCGCGGEMTSDHVPPKSMFPKPRPKLITIPCCKPCHKAKQKDDEYLVIVLAGSENVKGNPKAEEVYRKTVRPIFYRKESAGFRRAQAQVTSPTAVFTIEGLFAGIKYETNVETERLCQAVTRITKGIFHDKIGKRLSDDYDVLTAFPLNWPDHLIKELDQARDWCLASPHKTLVEDQVFWYSFVRDPEYDENLSIWVLVFYEAYPFFSFTAPRSLSEEKDTQAELWKKFAL